MLFRYKRPAKAKADLDSTKKGAEGPVMKTRLQQTKHQRQVPAKADLDTKEKGAKGPVRNI